MVALQNELIPFIENCQNNPKIIFSRLFRNKELSESIRQYTDYLPKETKLAQRTFHIVYNIMEIPTCKVCTNKVKFHDFRSGYHTYCSTKCIMADPLTISKKEQTCLLNYGVKNPSQHPDIQTRKKETWLAIYGVDHPFKAKEIRQKVKATMLLNHGVDHPSKSEAIKAQKKAKSQLVYGTDNISQADEIKAKKAYSLYANGTGACSKQQKYIHDLIGGELNYPVGRCMLDIAFPEDDIYFEYDGGGHDTPVKFGTLTQKQFDKKETKRNYFLGNRGWKKICLVSRKDFLPTDSILTLIVTKARTILQERSWVSFDIDKGEISTSKFTEFFDFGELQKVR